MDIEFTKSDFEKFRQFFYRKTGIFFPDSKKDFVEKRIIKRIEETGHSSFRSYFNFIRFDRSSDEIQNLINLLTINETYFFREKYQFECLVENVLDEIYEYKEPDEVIRIWSIPCSSGEEPYSIAIYLLEYWPLIDEVDVEIIASDIDTDVLDKAKKGIYNYRSVKNLPKHLLRKYFKKLSNDRYEIIDDLKETIDFRQLNLFDPRQNKEYRYIDVIFCRNMLIYFDDESRLKAAQIFYDAMNPGGFIFLGHSESMSRICSLFKVRKFKQGIVYQKPF